MTTLLQRLTDPDEDLIQDSLSEYIQLFTSPSKEELNEVIVTQNNEVFTILFYAIHYALDIEIIKLLVQKEVDLNVRDQHGRTAFLIACDCSPKVCYLAALSEKSDVSAVDNDGDTAVMKAAFRRNLRFLKYLLLDLRLNPNAQNNCGETALHMLFLAMPVDDCDWPVIGEMIKLLINCGADYTIKDSYGINALELAVLKGYFFKVKEWFPASMEFSKYKIISEFTCKNNSEIISSKAITLFKDLFWRHPSYESILSGKPTEDTQESETVKSLSTFDKMV